MRGCCACVPHVVLGVNVGARLDEVVGDARVTFELEAPWRGGDPPYRERERGHTRKRPRGGAKAKRTKETGRRREHG